MKVVRTFDVFVIGTGSAGSSAAFACAEAGLKVGISDDLPFGGTCALRGCDPKKMLVAAEETVDLFNRMKSAGAVSGSVAIDWAGLMKFKRSFTDLLPSARERSYADAGIAAFHGHAEFAASDRLSIGDENISAAHFVIATGERPMDLQFSGDEHVIDSTHFLECETLPANIVFVGGGYISFEFAHICARAGSKATIFHRGKRPLEQFDVQLVGKLVEATETLGIDVLLEFAVSSVVRNADGFTVTAGDRTIETDLVVHGAGRMPAIGDLNLDAAGVDWNRKGVAVNDFLQSTSNPRVYAAGDAARTGGPPLTPVANYTGSIAAKNILKPNTRKAHFGNIPSIVFTTPSLGSVGLTQDRAEGQALAYRINEGDSSRWYSSRRVNEKTSAYRVLIDKESDRILGAHVLGPGTEELINLFALAMQSDLTATKIQNTMMAYPTYGSDMYYLV